MVYISIRDQQMVLRVPNTFMEVAIRLTSIMFHPTTCSTHHHLRYTTRMNELSGNTLNSNKSWNANTLIGIME